MDARRERKLRMFAAILIGGMVGGTIYVISRIGTAPTDILVGLTYGLLISAAIGAFEFLAASGTLYAWLSSLSFTANLLVRSAVYAAVIVCVQYFDLGVRLVGLTPDHSRHDFLSATLFSAAFSVAMNFLIGVVNIIGARSFFHLATGRYHAPVEENRFVLFVDIAGSTGLAEKLGGLGIHRFLDRTFRLLTVSVVDYRGEVLNYVGDEVIVTWTEKSGALDCRPLRCFLAMREALDHAATQFEKDFGAAPRIRGSLHFGSVIVGEIGNIKRAIVFNGDVMNTASRLEALSRDVEGGFLVSRAALDKFASPPPVALRPLGLLSIRGRADGIDVAGLAV
jgi:adenylate cyclase